MKKSTTRTAYHEAGHAVVYLFLCRKFEYVTIQPNETALGHVKGMRTTQERLYNMSLRTMIHEVMIYYAGQAAEEILLKKRLPVQSWSDHEAIVDYLLSFMEQKEIDLFIAWVFHRTKSILNSRWDQGRKNCRCLIATPYADPCGDFGISNAWMSVVWGLAVTQAYCRLIQAGKIGYTNWAAVAQRINGGWESKLKIFIVLSLERYNYA